MPSRGGRRSKVQSGVELLTTYGFAILIILIAIAILFLFSRGTTTVLPYSCSIYGTLKCADVAYGANAAGATTLALLASVDIQGTVNVTAFSALVGGSKGIGYCSTQYGNPNAPHAVYGGNSIYCTATFPSGYMSGRTYTGTFNITGGYCPSQESLSCPASNAYVFTGSFSTLGVAKIVLPTSVTTSAATTSTSLTTTSTVAATTTTTVPQAFYAYVYGFGGSNVLLTSGVYYAPVYSNGAMGPWTQGTSYPVNASQLSCAMAVPAVNNRAYCVGGNTTAGPSSAAYAALAKETGTGGTGAWSLGSAYGSVEGESCVSYFNYLYCMSGKTTGGGNQKTVAYTTLSSSGFGSWLTSASYPFSVWHSSCAMYEGYVYCVGGSSGTASNNGSIAYYAHVLPSGALSSWTSTTMYPLGISGASCGAYDSYIYCVGGSETGGPATDAAYYAPISSNGIGQWAATAPYPEPDVNQGSCTVVSNGYIYCAGGLVNGQPTKAVYYAQLTSAGLGPWQAGPSYPQSISKLSLAAPQPAEQMSIALYPHLSTVTIGQSLTFTNVTLGASPPFTFAYATNAPSGSFNTGNAFVFDIPGTYNVVESVTNSTGNTVYSNPSIITVIPAGEPLNITLSPRNETIQVGGSVNFTNTTTGGAPPYGPYSYPGYSNSGNSITFGTVGSYNVVESVTDSAGEVAYSKNSIINVTYIHQGVVSYAWIVGGQLSWLNQVFNASQGEFDYIPTSLNTSRVYFAPIYSNGTLGPWIRTAPYPFNVSLNSCQLSAAAGYVLNCVGGNTSAGPSSATYYAYAWPGAGTPKIQAWVPSTPYPTRISGQSCGMFTSATTGGGSNRQVMYCVGGFNGSKITNAVYAANLTASGMGSWVKENPYPLAVSRSSCNVYGGIIYCVGGTQNGGANTSAAYYAAIYYNGELGPWQQGTAYPAVTAGLSCSAYNSQIYCLGGPGSSASYYASIPDTGGIGPWSSSTAYPGAGPDPFCGEAELQSSANLYCTGGTQPIPLGEGGSGIGHASIGSSGLGTWIGESYGDAYPAIGYTGTINLAQIIAPISSPASCLTSPGLPSSGGSTQSPFDVVFNPKGNLAYVADAGEISVINVATNSVASTINLPSGDEPDGLAFSPNGAYLYITATGGQSGTSLLMMNVSTGAESTILCNLPDGFGPFSLAISPKGNLGYMAITNFGVQQFNLFANGSYNPVGQAPAIGEYGAYSMLFNPSGTKAYSTGYTDAPGGDSFAATSWLYPITPGANSIGTSIATTGVDSEDAAVVYGGARVYITNAGLSYAECESGTCQTGFNYNVNVFNTSNGQFLYNVTVGPRPTGIVYDPVGSPSWPAGIIAYVADSGTNAVSVVGNSGGALLTITVGNNPWGLAVNPSNTLLYVTNSGDDTVSVVSTATNLVVKTINLG